MSWNKIDTSKLEKLVEALRESKKKLEQERLKTLERAKSIAEVIKKEHE